MVICENCGDETRGRTKCPDCGKMVCTVCRVYFGATLKLANGTAFLCEHGNPPFWKMVSWDEISEDEIIDRIKQKF